MVVMKVNFINKEVVNLPVKKSFSEQEIRIQNEIYGLLEDF